MDIRTWIFPTLCFILFCYAMIFIGVFTYYMNPNVSLFQSQSGIQTKPVPADIEEYQKELQKKLTK